MNAATEQNPVSPANQAEHDPSSSLAPPTPSHPPQAERPVGQCGNDATLARRLRVGRWQEDVPARNLSQDTLRTDYAVTISVGGKVIARLQSQFDFPGGVLPDAIPHTDAKYAETFQALVAAPAEIAVRSYLTRRLEESRKSETVGRGRAANEQRDWQAGPDAPDLDAD